jgi:hypothetical protein
MFEDGVIPEIGAKAVSCLMVEVNLVNMALARER